MIYSAFGSKAGVLIGMADVLNEEAGITLREMHVREATDPRALVILYVRRGDTSVSEPETSFTRCVSERQSNMTW